MVVWAALAAPATAEPPPEARWLADGADIIGALTTSPGECLAPPETNEAAYRVEVGRAAFRSPYLFGGVAARAGLSCNSCHRDGRDNDAFHFEGLSGAPGTADVTSSIFSKVREDGRFNPVKIPTLVGVAGKTSFGASSPHGSLTAFVESAVDEEFGGEPPPAVVSAIADYVAHLSAGACPPAPAPVSAPGALADVRRTLLAARSALARGEPATADFLFAAARGALAPISARFPGDGLAEERAALLSLSQAIAGARSLAARAPDAAAPAIDGLLPRIEATSALLAAAQPRSLYDPGRLGAALAEAGGAP